MVLCPSPEYQGALCDLQVLQSSSTADRSSVTMGITRTQAVNCYTAAIAILKPQREREKLPRRNFGQYHPFTGCSWASLLLHEGCGDVLTHSGPTSSQFDLISTNTPTPRLCNFNQPKATVNTPNSMIQRACTHTVIAVCVLFIS